MTMNDLNDAAQGSESPREHISPYQPQSLGKKSKQAAIASNVSSPIARANLTPYGTNRTADVFQSHRARLFGIAYRMLGSRAEAEDLVQEAYLRWHQSATEEIQSPIAFLVTITTRLCLDRLRELKQDREQY